MNNNVIDQFGELVTTQTTPQVEALIKTLKGETNIDFLRGIFGRSSDEIRRKVNLHRLSNITQ